MFSKLSQEGITKMSFYLKEIKFKKNFVVIKVNEEARNWYTVIEGEFKATKNIIIEIKKRNENLS